MDDGKEWKLSSVNSFKISPDGKSVAILQHYNGIKLSKILSNVLRVWNFEDDEVPIVIEDFSDAFSNMDWIY